MKIEDAFGFKKFKKVGFNENAKGGEDAVGVGVLAFELGGSHEVFASAGVKKDVTMLFEDL